MATPGIFRHTDGVIPNTLVFGFTLTGFFLALYLITHVSLAINLLGSVLLAQCLVFSAYLTHELAHNTIFSSNKLNRGFGELMLWLNGSCYFGFQRIKQAHINHHARRADIILFDYLNWLNHRSALTRKTIVLLEWAYIPAIEFVMRWAGIYHLFINSRQKGARLRLLNIFLIRSLGFALLAYFSPPAMLFYCLAFIVFLNVTRFMDAHQHDFQVYTLGADGEIPQIPKNNKAYENAHTYSNLIARRFPWLNLLVLNFCYHNAHHENPAMPWHRLARFHQQIKHSLPVKELPFHQLLANYHRYRIQRLFNNEPLLTDTAQDNPLSWEQRFIGVVGVSFLY